MKRASVSDKNDEKPDDRPPDKRASTHGSGRALLKLLKHGKDTRGSPGPHGEEPDVLSVRFSRILALGKEDLWALAERRLMEAFDIRELEGGSNLDVAQVAVSLGSLAVDTGRVEAARAYGAPARTSLARRSRLFAPRNFARPYIPTTTTTQVLRTRSTVLYRRRHVVGRASESRARARGAGARRATSRDEAPAVGPARDAEGRRARDRRGHRVPGARRSLARGFRPAPRPLPGVRGRITGDGGAKRRAPGRAARARARRDRARPKGGRQVARVAAEVALTLDCFVFLTCAVPS